MGRYTELTEATKKNILKLFFRTELRWNEETIDNSSVAIAEELGIKASAVNTYMDGYFKNRSANKKNLTL